MSILDKIKRGDSSLPHRIVLAGPEGIGKSTFASKAPSPAFIAAEDGLTGLEHVNRITPGSLDELYTTLDALPGSPFKTAVIDTADWLERFVCAEICKRDSKSSIEEYGWGKGFTVMEEEMVKILNKLDQLRAKGIGTVILSHVNIRTFNDPTGMSWDRYEMKGHKKWTGLLREWPDAVLFATRQVFKTKDKAGKETTIGGDRVVHTEWSVAWDAKNRLNLPPEISLDWDELAAAIKANSPETLRAKAKRLITTAKFSDSDKERWGRWAAAIETQPADRLKTAIEKLETLQK